MCWGSSVVKYYVVADDDTCNFIKKETLAQVFSSEFCEISKNTFSYRRTPVAASMVNYFKQKFFRRRVERLHSSLKDIRSILR